MAELWKGQLSLNGETMQWILYAKVLQGFAPDDTDGEPLTSFRLKEIEELKRGSNGIVFNHQGGQVRLRGGPEVDALLDAIFQARPECEFARRPSAASVATAATVATAPAADPASADRGPPTTPRNKGSSSAVRAPSADEAAGRSLSPESAAKRSGSKKMKTLSRPTSPDSDGGAVGRQSTAVDVRASLLVDSLCRLIETRGLRVADIFRNPLYNPSYLVTRDEELDAEELLAVLEKAGMETTVKHCRALILLINGGSKSQIDMRQLEAAVRAHKRGKDIWDDPEIERLASMSSKKSQRDFTRRSLVQEEIAGPQWAAPTLQAISNMLDEKRVRIADIFRHPHFNPSYLKTGDESLDAEEIAEILKKADLNISVKEIANMIACIDEDANGTLEIAELETAIRRFRRGTMIWIQPKEKVKKRLDLEHLHSLHKIHDVKLKRLEEERCKMVEEENLKLRKAKKDNRLGTRATVNPRTDYKAEDVGERLYDHRKDYEHKLEQKIKKWETIEQEQLEARRVRPARSASEPATQREIKERNSGWDCIGHRLHAVREDKDNRRRKIREEDEARLLMETDRIAQEVISRSGGAPPGGRHDQLHIEAKEREERRAKLRWMHIEAEAARHASRAIGAGRPALTSLEKIEELHREHKMKTQKRAEHAAKQAKLDKEQIEARAVKHKSLWKEEKMKEVPSRWADELDEAPEPRKPRPVHVKGFGCQAPRSWLPQQASAWCIESVDHALSTVNTIVSSRCNCVPDERQFEVLQDLIEPLQQAIEEYRDADAESRRFSEGAEYLRTTDSMRLFSDGRLMEDHWGWHTICEADKLRQLHDDFDVLMEQAERAQTALLAKVGPGDDHADAARLGKRWPRGAKWNHPAATKKAQFAYNPGMKNRDAARQKAFVRYGPSEGKARHWHLLDLARCCLVFVDATLLRAGLEQIRERFEVVDIRNYYHPSNGSFLGQKYVEVLVVLKLPEPFLCEIRLEEYSYFIARQRALPHVEKIAEVFSELYGSNGADPEMIKYLAKWSLFQPKEPHAVSVFKKHLAHKFGSTCVAWRNVMGGGNQVNFNTFRRVCSEVGQRHRSSEFWQLLDAARAGCISLFELDPDAVILLIKFFWRICGMATKEQLETPQSLFDRLTSKSVVRLNQPGRLEAHEFRRVCKVIGFSHVEADRVFELLDSQGGSARKPPVTLQPQDLFWLNRLPEIVNVDCVMLKDPRFLSEGESLRSMTYSGRVFNDTGRRARTPNDISKRLSVRQSVSARPSLVFARRSLSTPDLQGRGSVRGSVRSKSPSVAAAEIAAAVSAARGSVSSRSSRAASPGSKRRSQDAGSPTSPDSQGTTEPGRSPPTAFAESETEGEADLRSPRGGAESEGEPNLLTASETEGETDVRSLLEDDDDDDASDTF